MKKPMNQPAFPCAGGPHHAEGMTLRDYFAGVALPVIMERDDWILDREKKRKVVTDKDMARAAYYIADAMLAARTREDTLHG